MSAPDLYEPEDLLEQAVAKQRLRAAGLPLLTNYEQDIQGVFAASQVRDHRLLIRATAKHRRCVREGLL